jgi:hypothetical protein
MIRLPVGGSGGGVGVFCLVVKFRGSIVRTLRHGVLLTRSMQTSRAESFGAISREVRIKRKGSTLIAFPQ